MDLVYIYGPPAAGKYTLALEIARRTGFKLFHNHLTIDCVLPVFEFGSPPFWRLVHSIREGVIAEAARTETSMVFTTVYNHPESQPQTLRRFAAAEENGGRVCLVHLLCSKSLLEERVLAPHRGDMGKIATVEQLRTVMAANDVVSPIPGRESLRIDSSALSPTEAAALVIEAYGLTELSFNTDSRVTAP